MMHDSFATRLKVTLRLTHEELWRSQIADKKEFEHKKLWEIECLK